MAHINSRVQATENQLTELEAVVSSHLDSIITIKKSLITKKVVNIYRAAKAFRQNHGTTISASVGSEGIL